MIIEAKAANVWIRRKSAISANTCESIYKDLSGCYGLFDQFYKWAQSQGKNVVVYVSGKKATIGFWIKLAALSALIAVYYFSQRFLLYPGRDYHTVPNSKFIESRITNWTHPRTRMRGNVKVGVSYNSDPELVKEVLLEVVKQNPNVRTYPEPFVRFAEFGNSALLFELYFWADNPGKRWFTQSELHFAIAKAFRNKNIEIAFPQRDIHIRSVVPFPIHGLPDQGEQQGNQETKA
jgi:small-conductance mechanosensitive channel